MKIKEAVEKGELKNLPGEGKALELEQINPFVPPEERMTNKIMSNLGLTPPEVELRKEMEKIREMIEKSHDQEEIKKLKRRLQEVKLSYNTAMDARKR